MDLQIDHNSSTPLHVQVEELLRSLIRQRPYTEGRLLPDELQLARQLSVSRGTVRNAIGRLVHDGLVERRRGVGTRVKSGVQHSGLANWQSFRAEMAARGIEVEEMRVKLRQVASTEAVAVALGISAGRKVWHLSRVRGWDGVPAVMMVSHFHPQIQFTGDETFEGGLYDELKTRFSIIPVRSEERITAELAKGNLAKHLFVPSGSPLLVRRRVAREAGGRAIEFAVNYYNSNRCNYSLELERHP